MRKTLSMLSVTYAVCALLILSILIGVGRVRHWHNQLDDAQAAARLVRDSLDATHDTTRLVAIIGDSLQVLQKRAIQSAMEKDALDKQLKLTTKMNEVLSAQVASFDSTVAGHTIVNSAGVRTATFHVRQVPYTIESSVSIPNPDTQPDVPPNMAISVVLDVAHLDIRVGCAAPKNGLRTATVSVVTELWLKTEIGSAQQAPEICNPVKPHNKSRFGLGVGAGVGLVVLVHSLLSK